MMPTYLKTHSYGEYVFDWSWADAWQRMGLQYYPKLVTAVPFTPATGQRLGHVGQQNISAPRLVEAVKALTDTLRVSSWHVLFLDEASSKQLCDCNMPQRLTTQFHWFNQAIATFRISDRFSSRKRKNLRGSETESPSKGCHSRRSKAMR